MRVGSKTGSIYADTKGYPCITVYNVPHKIHILVWQEAYCIKPSGHDIHHIDFDKANYALDNLQLLTQSDHKRVHAGWVMTDGKWTHKPCNGCETIQPLGNFYGRKGYTPTALCKPCHNEAIKQRLLRAA